MKSIAQLREEIGFPDYESGEAAFSPGETKFRYQQMQYALHDILNLIEEQPPCNPMKTHHHQIPTPWRMTLRLRANRNS